MNIVKKWNKVISLFFQSTIILFSIITLIITLTDIQSIVKIVNTGNAFTNPIVANYFVTLVTIVLSLISSSAALFLTLKDKNKQVAYGITLIPLVMFSVLLMTSASCNIKIISDLHNKIDDTIYAILVFSIISLLLFVVSFIFSEKCEVVRTISCLFGAILLFVNGFLFLKSADLFGITMGITIILVSIQVPLVTISYNRKKDELIEDLSFIESYDALVKLQELKDKNIITEEEFNEKRSKYVDKL